MAGGNNGDDGDEPGQNDPEKEKDDELRSKCSMPDSAGPIYVRTYAIDSDIGNSFDFDNLT